MNPQAIMYAVEEWHADIITMSFGFDDEVTEILKAIEFASKRALLLASASNSGGNAGIAWPARCPDVVAIFASNHEGNKYVRNPDPVGKQNFSVLGDHVEGWKPGTDGKEHRSGTSTAAPIAAGITAIILAVLRHGKIDFLARLSEENRESARERYNRALEKAKDAHRMRAVLEARFSALRDGYNYVSPWRHVNFERILHKTTLIEEIIQILLA